MRVFIRIVDTNSFTRAAESLDLPRATVTTIVQNLESLLGAQLLLRTTRRISLTSEGAAYYERCMQILDDIDELEASLRHSAEQLSGHLRVEIPGTIANAIVLPAMDEFHARYPRVDLSVCVSHRATIRTCEAVDCSVQLGALPDSNLIARRLGSLEHLTCASPQYLERHGVPKRIEELSQHVAVNCMSPLSERSMDFEFDVGGVRTNLKVGGFLKVSDEQACLSSALQGIGLIQPARIAALPYLKSGALREVLPQWKPMPRPVSAVFTKSRRGSLRVRAIIDWLVELFDRSGAVHKNWSPSQQIMYELGVNGMDALFQNGIRVPN
jgi:DNA-binding transcriptional LysR family regulator